MEEKDGKSRNTPESARMLVQPTMRQLTPGANGIDFTIPYQGAGNWDERSDKKSGSFD